MWYGSPAKVDVAGAGTAGRGPRSRGLENSMPTDGYQPASPAPKAQELQKKYAQLGTVTSRRIHEAQQRIVSVASEQLLSS